MGFSEGQNGPPQAQTGLKTLVLASHTIQDQLCKKALFCPRWTLLSHFEVPLNSRNNNNFGAFGGPMARATWAWRLLRGFLWVLKYPYCHQMNTQTHPRADIRVSEKVKV